METPFLDKFRHEAENYLKKKRIRTIDFSHSTYQIEVADLETDESVWPFLQFDEEENLSDAFCTCPEEETCPHLASALLRIYNGTAHPLHVRFQKSLWKALTTLFARHLGFEPSKKKEEEGRSFSIVAKNEAGRKFLSSLLKKRTKETPETSLKFSNLSQEEIAKWKAGRAGFDLLYELSFWSDLAKKMMFLQDEKAPYKISVEEVEGLPLHLTIDWNEISLSFTYLPEDLPELIESFATVDSPLKVHADGAASIESITFLPERFSFRICHREGRKGAKQAEKAIDGWLYVSGEGFFPGEGRELVDHEEIPKEQIGAFLDQNHEKLASFFTEIPLHTTPEKVHTHLFFDEKWNLHIDSYLFERGDAHFFGKWAYVEGKGFFALKTPPLPEKVIPADEVSTFVHYHRNFLNTLPPFSIHLASVETAITYHVDEKGVLRFLNKFGQESSEMKDFGDWVYYKGQGFFPKRAPGLSSTLFVGLEVQPRDLPTFLKLHRDELEILPHFFIEGEVVESRGLHLSLLTPTTLQILPVCELVEQYRGHPFRLYGDFIYVQDIGFQELAYNLRLPVRFQEKMVLNEKEFAHFFEEEFSAIRALCLTVDPRLETPLKLDLTLTKLKRVSGGMEMEGYYEGTSGKVSLHALQEAFEAGKRYLFSEAGRIDLQEERFRWMERINSDGGLTLPAIDFFRLDIVEGVLSANREVREILEELRTFQTHEEISLTGLASQLRLYQKSGLEWLWFLYRNGLSGLLCDEMGLGKTHQAMALLAGAKNLKKKARFLIVAPTSVIYHWQEKLAQFLPEFKVHFFHGFKRSLKNFPQSGILLTSYGILRSEKKALSKIGFEIAIYDEVQVAKNPSSRIHNALLEVDAHMRVGLTGTPIENYLRELKALFDLVLPGYMPGEAEFKERFSQPIERDQDTETKALLNKLIKPFILRRKKQEVLSELPEKTIDTFSCDLSEEQRLLYLSTLEKERKPIVAQLQSGEGTIPYVHIFSILSKLKQICDHPALALKTPHDYKLHQSGKWELFVELLNEAIEGEQKVVIFSQYLQMLDIIAAHVKEQGWSYAEIRGSSLDRKEQMERFQNDPQCLVFLGSLNAAGLGIDLTAASIVILYDRWWNAARENQAIDRVHRIGQKWGVQVYKLLTKGTIEEKIDQIIARKGRLLEEIVTSDDEATIKRFSREELIDLLSLPVQK